MRRYRRRAQDFFPRARPWHVCCIQCEAGEVRSFKPSFALTPTGGSAYRRPPVWRAVVRPARYFLWGRSRLRRFGRAHLGRDRDAGKKRGFCRRKVGRLGTRAFQIASSLSVVTDALALPDASPLARRCRNQQAWGRGGRSRLRWLRLRRLSRHSRSRRSPACDVQPAADVTS